MLLNKTLEFQDTMTNTITFYVNGKRIEEPLLSTNRVLARYLRDDLRLTGCKVGCGQGVCGSCTVLVSWRRGNSLRHEAVNACLLPLASCHMKAITTVEALGSVRTRLQPLQNALADGHAVQCGFCTPGFVMSGYALLRNRKGKATSDELKRALKGNLCRCTGYRPIVQAIGGVCCGGGSCQNGAQVNVERKLDSDEDKDIDITQELIFPPRLLARCHDDRHFRISGPRVEWTVPLDMDQADEELKNNPHYLVIGGNTMQTLKYETTPNTSVLDLRNLNEFSVEHGKLSIGAGLTLKEIEEHMRDSLTSDITKDFYAAFLQILENHSSSQITAVATIGGSIASVHRYPFVSVLLASVEAKLTVFDRRSSNKSLISMADLNETLLSQIVIFRVEVSLASISKLRFYQPADEPLRWSLSVMESRTRDLLLSFSASGQTEGTYKVRTIHGDFPSIFREMETMTIDEDALRLYQGWRSFFSGDEDSLQTAERSISSHIFPSFLSSDGVLGAPIVTTNANEATSGEATYLDDVSPSRNELHLALVPSAHAHAKILSIDASEALKMPGVVAFISAADVPCNRVVVVLPPADEEVFAEREVKFKSQSVGAIAAENREIALEAANLVVVKYEPLPAVLTIEEADAKAAFLRSAFCPSHEVKLERGEAKEGRSTVHGEIQIDGQEHFYMEPQSALVIPTLEDTFTAYSGTHSPSVAQKTIAQALKVPMHKVDVQVRRIGGSFGGKETRCNVALLPAAVAAYKLRRPVRCVLPRDLDIRISGGRHPVKSKYDISIKDGKIEGLWLDVTLDGGCSLDSSTLIRDNLIRRCQNGYKVPNFKYVGRVCKTNRSSKTAFRGFGGPQGAMAVEMAIEHAAQVLGLCPDDVRERSIAKSGDQNQFGTRIPSNDDNLRRCFSECKDKADYDNRLEFIKKFNLENKDWKRGMAIVPVSFGIGFASAFMNQGSALVNVYSDDGTILIHHSGVEIGQGIDIKMQQIAAHLFGLPLSLFHVNHSCTNVLPNVIPTVNSSTTDIVGPAVIDACKTLIKRLNWRPADDESEEKRVTRWRGVVSDALMSKIDLSARGFFAHDNKDFGFDTQGDFFYNTYGAACSEVVLNCLTGEYALLRADIVMDVGKSLNPAVDVGQIEGGFIQGFGLFCKERLNFKPNDGFPDNIVQDYTIANVNDIPRQFNVHLLTEAENKAKHAVYSSKGIGEPPFLLGMSVYFALRRALHAIDPDCQRFIRIDCPATSDRVRKAIEEMKSSND